MEKLIEELQELLLKHNASIVTEGITTYFTVIKDSGEYTEESEDMKFIDSEKIYD